MSKVLFIHIAVPESGYRSKKIVEELFRKICHMHFGDDHIIAFEEEEKEK